MKILNKLPYILIGIILTMAGTVYAVSILSIPQGGTGVGSFPAKRLIVSNPSTSTGTLQSLAIGADKTLLIASSTATNGLAFVATSTLGFSGGSTNPAGSNTQVQYNNGGLFGADSNFTWASSTLVLSLGSSSQASTSTSTLQTTGDASQLAIKGADAISLDNLGGNILISGGQGATTSAGTGFPNGGTVTLRGGQGGYDRGSGGNIQILGGVGGSFGGGDNNGGNVILRPGKNPAGISGDGNIQLLRGSQGIGAIINLSQISGLSQTFSFPAAGGTLVTGGPIGGGSIGNCAKWTDIDTLDVTSNPCGTVTNVTASGNLSSSGGTTPAITITNSPSFSGTLNVTGTSTLATTTITNLSVGQLANCTNGVITGAAGLFACNGSAFLTGNQTITINGVVSGSGATTITTAFNSTTPISFGGTGTTTAPTATGQILASNGTGWGVAKFINGANVTITTSTPGSITIASTDQFQGTVTSVSGSGGTTGLTLTGGAITNSGTLTIGGILIPANGGTGTTSLGNLTLTSSNLSFGSGDGKNILIGTSTNITLAASPSFTNGTFTGTLGVTGISTLASTTISQLTLGNGLTSSFLAVNPSGVVIATTTPLLTIGSGTTNNCVKWAGTNLLGDAGAPCGNGGGGSGGGWATSSPAYITTAFPSTTGALVGINSSTPTGQLVIEGTSGTTTPVFIVASSSNASTLTVASNGNISFNLLGTGIIHSSSVGLLSSSAIVGGDIQNSTIDLTSKVTGVLPIANGGTGTTTPGLIQGANITITGTWPFQTITGSAGGSGNSAWTIGNGLIYNATSTDLVGIGTITPTTTLFVQGKGGTNPFTIASSTGSSIFSVTSDDQVQYTQLISVIHANGTMSQYNATTSSNIARGQALRNAVANESTGDSIYLAANTFDLGENTLDLSNNGTLTGISLYGSGKYATVIKSQYSACSSGCTQTNVNTHPPIIHPGTNTTVANLSIIANHPIVQQDQYQLPWGQNDLAATGNTPFASTTLLNVYVEGTSDGLQIISTTSPLTVEIDNVTVNTIWDTAFFNVATSTITIRDSVFNAIATSSLNNGDIVHGIEDFGGGAVLNSFNNMVNASDSVLGTAFGAQAFGYVVADNAIINVYGGSITTSVTDTTFPPYDFLLSGVGTPQINITANTSYNPNKILKSQAAGVFAYLDSNPIIKSFSNGNINVGVNSTTPIADLVVQGQNGSTTPILIISSSTNSSLFQIKANGDVLDTELTSGNCVQAGAGGLLTTTSLPCGSGGGGATTTITAGLKINGPDFTFASGSPDTTWNILASGSTVTFDHPNNLLTTANVSGTNGQLPYFTAANTLASAAIMLYNGTVFGMNATSSTIGFNIQGTAGTNDILNVASSSGTSILRVTALSKVGIGSSTPISSLVVEGIASQTYPILSVATSTNTSVLTINANGTAAFQSPITSTAAFAVNNTSGNSILNIDNTTPTGGSYILSVASSTGVAMFAITGSSHITSSSTSPTLTSCGTSPSIVGNDAWGEVSVGSVAATGCTITFAVPYTNAPICTIEEQTGSVANAFNYTISTTAITVTQTGLTSDKLDYHCFARGE